WTKPRREAPPTPSGRQSNESVTAFRASIDQAQRHMQRSFAPEILDDPNIPDEVLDHSYHDLTRTHRWLGHTGLIVRALRRHAGPLHRVMDIGCGRGGMLRDIRQRLAVEVIGVDLRVPETGNGIPIVRADAVHDPLPSCDVALAVCLVHHLSDAE